MQRILLVPARLNSTRLNNKLLLDIAGKPLLQRTLEQAQSCYKKYNFDRLILCSDSDELIKIGSDMGIEVFKTDQHPTGTDRLAETAEKLDFDDDSIVVNIQGDEPCIPIENIQQVAQNLENNPSASISSLYEEINNLKDFINPNCVKVVLDHNNFALYFSRAPIPWVRGESRLLNYSGNYLDNNLENKELKNWGKMHIGLYAYRVKFLKQFAQEDQSNIELLEGLEQLRALSMGCKIHMDKAAQTSQPGVDTIEGLERVRGLF